MTWTTATAGAVLIVAACVGTAVALSGAPEVALIIWTGGGLLAVSIAFLAPWLFLLFGEDDAPDAR